MEQDREPSPPPTATQLLQEWNQGDPEAGARLVPVVYEELRRLAAAHFAGPSEQHTLQPTALVHECFLRLVGKPADFRDRAHFFAVAARAMRQVAVDSARRRRARKRGGDAERVTLSGLAANTDAPIDALDLEEALSDLAKDYQRAARVAELRLFAGLNVQEVAEAIEVSPRTVDYDWRFARSWLRKALGGAAP